MIGPNFQTSKAQFDELFGWVSSVASATDSFVMPILNYGRIVNQIHVDDAGFPQTVLIGTVKNRETLSRVRRVLLALQAQLRIKDDQAITRGDVAPSKIATYQALGGGSQIRGNDDVASNAVKVKMAPRTNWGELLKPENHLTAPQIPDTQVAP